MDTTTEQYHREVALRHALSTTYSCEPEIFTIQRANAFYQFIVNGTVPTREVKD